MSAFQSTAILLVVIAATSWIQWLLKTRKNDRYSHFAFLTAALILFALATFFYSAIAGLLSGISYISRLTGGLGVYTKMVYAILFTWVYIALKARWLRKSAMQQVPFRKLPFLAYKRNQFGVAVLRNEFEFARIASVIGIMIAGFIILSALVMAAYGLYASPLYTGLSLALFIELAQYFSGNKEITFSDEISGEDASLAVVPRDFEQLWEKYRTIWKGKLLLAWKGISPHQPASQILLVDKRLKGDADVIIGDDQVTLYGKALFNTITDTLIEGKNVIVVCNAAEPGHLLIYKQQFDELFQNGLGNPHYKVEIYRPHQGANSTSLLIVQTCDIIECCSREQSWLNNAGIVLFFKANELFADSLNTCSFLSDYLQRTNSKIKTLVISHELYNLKSACLENLNMKATTTEIEPFIPRSQNIFSLIWMREGLSSFQDALFSGHIPHDMGAEPVLLIPAIENSRLTIDVLESGGYPAVEQINEVQNNKNDIMPDLIDLRLIENDITEQVNVVPINSFVKSAGDKIMFIRDVRNNFIVSLKKWERAAGQNALIHVISLPYLYRDFMAAHFEFFYAAPMQAFCPKKAQSRFNTAFSLLQKLLLFELSAQELAGELTPVKSDDQPIAEKICVLFHEIFGIRHVLPFLSIKPKYNFDIALNKFILTHSYSISADHFTEKIDELTPITIKDNETGAALMQLNYGNLYQNYLPFQIHYFNGKAYEIPAIIDWTNQCMVVNHYTRFSYATYRPCLSVHIKSIMPPLTPDHVKQDRNVIFNLLEGEVTISTMGFVKHFNGIRFLHENDDFSYQPLSKEQVPARDYRSARILKIDFPSAFSSGLFLQTLAIVLQEAFYTIFADNHKYLCATTIRQTGFTIATRCLIPECISDKPETLKNSLLIIEDSFEDAGAVQCIFDHWEYILLTIDDYLEWCISGNVERHESFRFEGLNGSADNLSKHNAPAGTYLHYGFQGYPIFLDPVEAKRLLGELLGQNPITTKRKNFYASAKVYEGSPFSDYNACDLCGLQLPVKELDKLTDGRHRCKDCGETAVNAVPELEAIFQEGRYFLENTLGLGDTLPTGINVRFTNAGEVMQNLSSQIFMPTPGFDHRAVGFARDNGNGLYEIFIENGAPFHRTLDTVVHELAHIWQYKNLNMDLLRKDYGNLLIEGHALWAGLKMLETRGLAPQYCELEKIRDDDYGKGYSLVLHLFEQHPQFRGNAFEMLEKLYG